MILNLFGFELVVRHRPLRRRLPYNNRFRPDQQVALEEHVSAILRDNGVRYVEERGAIAKEVLLPIVQELRPDLLDGFEESGGEVFVPIRDGQYLVFQSADRNPAGTDYVRFVDHRGHELLYYDYAEWSESREQAKEVMGAIMGAIANGA